MLFNEEALRKEEPMKLELIYDCPCRRGSPPARIRSV